jgi:uncharacterized protein involved in exopolysaccharide biosynthesis
VEGIRNALQFQIDDLKSKAAAQSGRSSGNAATWAAIVAVLGLLAAVGALAVMLFKK